MKKRQVMAWMLAAAMTLTACGGAAASGSSSAAPADEAQTASASTEEAAAEEEGAAEVTAEDPGSQAVTLAEAELLSVDAKAQIVTLKTDGVTDPVGLDDETPAFSWQMASEVTGAAQSSYQIVVSAADGTEMWDSGVVESRESVDIAYEGQPLEARTAYSWAVTVTDTAGNQITSEPASFETGLMSEDIKAWNGAQMIGADELQVDAASLPGFVIKSGVQIPDGSNTASFIIGADDFRLENSSFNIHSVASEENYVRIELDISDVSGSGAKINVYRVGYAPEDSADTPLVTVADNEQLLEAITAANAHDAHEIEIAVNGSDISFVIDGTALKLKEKVTVNDLGGDSSYNSYPNLGSIGLSGDAVFTDFRVQNGGHYGESVLFDAETGATYAIFDGMEGVEADGNVITVSTDKIQYADPSYAAAPMLRKEFAPSGELEAARLYLTAQGIYNYYINGQEIAPDEWFNPGSESYDAYLAYNTYDVTELIKEGDNAMGAVLGEGWWCGQMTYDVKNANYYGEQPALMAMLALDYKDGTTEYVVTDDSWSYFGDGPVRLASFFQGERYDATKEAAVEGWTEAGFDASSWRNAAIIKTRAPFAAPALVTRTDKPVHIIRTNEVVESLGTAKEGSDSYIYDMGENVSGVPVITIPEDLAKEGETLTIRFAEILYPEMEEYTEAGIAGTLMVENYRAALVTDFYTMKAGEQVFIPDLTFHGYRYIEITGLGEELPAENVQMYVLSSLDAAATYTSSNELANQLFRNITNSTTSNYISIPTDCPQRNERLGWTGDAQVFALTGSYIADTYNFMDIWMDSVRADSNKETGISAQYSPSLTQYELGAESIEHSGMSFGITWNALAVTIPYNLYVQTGRKDIAEANIDNIITYVDHMIDTPFKYKDAAGEKKTDARLTGETGTLADHLARITTDSVILGEAVYIQCLDDAAILCEAVGNEEKASVYRSHAVAAREAWNEIFIDPETGKTRTAAGEMQDTQASYATALAFGVVSEENLEKVLTNYEATIAEASGQDNDGVELVPYTLTTGFNATGNLLPALSRYGLNETAYKMFESTEYASWLYPVTVGATSIWERWNSYTEEAGFNGNNAMNSFNHYSYGAVGQWMMAYQAGIQSVNGQPGYQTFILQPIAGGDYTDLAASYDSVYGTIRSGWTADAGVMTSYDATVPANTTATLYLPTTAADAVDAEGVTYVGAEVHNGIDVQVYQLAAGTYHFEIGESVTCG